MKIFLFVAMTFLFSSVHASPWIAGSYGMRFENDSDTNHLETRNPYGFIVGHRWENNEAFGEFSTFSTKSGNSTLEIRRSTQLGLLGYRYYPFEVKTVTWFPYLSVALGGSREIIITQLLGIIDERESKVSLIGAGGIGVWGLIVKHFRAGAEFRFLASQELTPAIMLDLSLRVGFEF